jgi:hypothetical protein
MIASSASNMADPYVRQAMTILSATQAEGHHNQRHHQQMRAHFTLWRVRQLKTLHALACGEHNTASRKCIR